MPEKTTSRFVSLARWIANKSGQPGTFILAVLVVLVWAITGPLFHFSDTWQLVINTGTTIVTFLMVFLIQNTQNRDTQALQVKLDELIRVMKDARNELIASENLEESELEQLKNEFEEVAQQARSKIEQAVDRAVAQR